MALLSPEEVSAVKSRLSGWSSKPPGRGGKTETHAAKLKEQGNQHFKRKKNLQALQCYSEAITLSPWSQDEERTVLGHLMECLDLPKRKVAANLVLQQENKMADSALLALCIGNRSAALYELGRIEESMADIEWALSLNFPVASEYKLHRRRACCLAQLGRKSEAYEALETAQRKILTCSTFSQEKKDCLTKETNEYHRKVECLLMSTQHCDNRTGSKEHISLCSAHTSDCIAEDSSPSKGRFLKAARPIRAREVVMAEEPYAAVLNQDLHQTHCSYCFRKTSALIPCCWCTSDLYCSSGCKEKGWRAYHWLECPVSSLWSKADWMMRCALRMVLSVSPSALHGAVTHTVNDSLPTTMPSSGNDLYDSILSLVAHENRFSDVLQKETLTKMTDTLTECFGDSITQYLAVEAEVLSSPTLTAQQMVSGLEGLFFHHLLQLRCNSHSVSVVEVEHRGTGPSREATEAGVAGEGLVETTKELQLGSALYPTASLFNHSCWPNAIFRFIGNTVAVVATKPIEKGEEINNCYGPQVGRMKCPERLAELKKKYFFDCICPACTHMDPDLDYQERVMDAYGCSGCGGILEQGAVQWVCCGCGRMVEGSELEDIDKLSREAERMFTAAMETSSDAGLPLLLKCHTLQSRVLHKHNMQLARTSDAVAHAYACQGDFQQAVQFCEASCRAVETVHGSHSIELATELQKLAQLLFNSCQFSAASEAVKKVLPIIQLYHPPNHPDVIELIHMKDILPHECS